MPISFLTSLTEEEFKDFLKQAITEALADQTQNTQPSYTEILDIKQAVDFLKLKVNTLTKKLLKKVSPILKREISCTSIRAP